MRSFTVSSNVNKEFQTVVEDLEVSLISDLLSDVEKEIEELEIKKEQYKSKLIDFLENSGIESALLKSHRVDKLARRGSVDYSKIPELRNVDVEKYRKEGSTYYRFSGR